MAKTVTIHFDGASKGNPGPAGIGAVIQDDSGERLEIKKYLGTATNNQAEYTALLESLHKAVEMKAKRVDVYSDSELVVKQLNGEYRIKDEKLKTLFDQVLLVARSFEKIKFTHVPREKNKIADALANEAVKEAARGIKGEKSEWIELRTSAFSAGALLAALLSQILEREASLPQASLLDAVSALGEIAEGSKGEKGHLFVKVRRDGKAFSLDWEI